MTAEEFYGDSLSGLTEAEERILELIRGYRKSAGSNMDFSTIQYYSSRIKSPDSMMQTLRELIWKGVQEYDIQV